ncbi:HAD-IA family hydrolase [Neobacillus niacini]|jgi:HAD superfamily hydrolase (TIGR01549 family)|uniref:HAD-IA family hydrolase n=1 Tax=Neobacillus niacini TaxID=86668 RepID=UPI001C8E3ADA|nr:HAD-IA family hydrolase [Neobacillus niacini]MBY0147922.1 HAD-IA family hydrolase [Neobacillus niacini]
MNILWDFDGTLFDTYPALVEGFVKLSERDLDKAEVLKWLKIDSLTAFKHYGIDESKRPAYKDIDKRYSKEFSTPFEHLESVLSAADHNIIVTHRDRESTLFLLEKFSLEKYFSEIVSVEEQGFNRKPHTASYEYVLKKYNIDLVVGDRELDLLPARKLGIKTVAFQNPDIEADLHLDSYDEFNSIVFNKKSL